MRHNSSDSKNEFVASGQNRWKTQCKPLEGVHKGLYDTDSGIKYHQSMLDLLQHYDNSYVCNMFLEHLKQQRYTKSKFLVRPNILFTI